MTALIALAAIVVAIVAYRRSSALKESIEELRREMVALRQRLGAVSTAAAPAPPPREPRREAAPVPTPRDRTRCDACGSVFPSHYYLQDAGPRGYICNACATSAPTPAPRRETAAPAPTRTEAATGRIETWEEKVGGSWLSRIGIVLLVIGIVFALGYTLTVLGPLGKALLATATSLLLIAGGVLLERRESYRLYGRVLIAGGWAALYATAYAVHELDATRVVRSGAVGFLLLLVVGAGMIVHSLRYRSQVLTTLAYGLAYAAIVLHSISAYTLAAASVLGAGTLLHLLRRRWYGIALGGIVATYGSLLLWYLRQGEWTGRTLQLGLGALTIDWIVFAAADFAPEPEDRTGRWNVWALGLINALCAGALAFLAWHRVDPGRDWQPLAGLGAVYVVTSASLRGSGRFTAHRAHSLAAAVLLGFAAWKGLDSVPRTWSWLIEAQLVVLLGIWLKDRFHRLLGSALFLAPMLAILYEEGGARAARPDGIFDRPMFLLTAVACGCFYLTFARLKPLVANMDVEEAIRRSFSYAALVLILVALWVQLPEVYVAPAAAVVMLVLFELAAVRGDRDFRIQAYLTSAGIAIAVLASIRHSEILPGGIHARVPAILVCAAAYFFVFLRQRGGRSAFPDLDLPLRPEFAWGGAALVTFLVWTEARPIVVGPAWMLLALFLVELGIALEEPHLRRPGYLVLVAAQVSLAMSNLNVTDEVGGISVRAATLVPCIVAGYYLWWRLRSLDGASSLRADETDERFGRVLSYLDAGLAALFFRFEFGLNGAALRWSVTMLALLVIGHLLRDADLRLQGYALAAAVFVRAVGFDFVHASPILGMNGARLIAIGGVVSYAAAAFLLRRRLAAGTRAAERRTLALESGIEARGQDLFWLLAVGLAAVYFFRTTSGFVLIVAWAVEGLCAAALGFALEMRSLRLAGLGLLGLGLSMTLFRAFTTFDTLGRIVSFLVLGVVLLLVSFGYARYRASSGSPR